MRSNLTCKRNKKWSLIWNKRIKLTMGDRIIIYSHLYSIIQIMTMARYKSKTWKICINQTRSTSKESHRKILMHNTKRKYFKVSNNRTVTRQLFNFKRQSMKSSQNASVNQPWSKLLLMPMKNLVDLKTILDPNPLKSQRCSITQWAATISAQCSTAPTNPWTKLTRTKIKMKIKKAIRYLIKLFLQVVLINMFTKK
jgi:hypothetical protein